MKLIKILFVSLFCLLVVACGGGADTSSNNVAVAPGDIPDNFIGVYRGTLDVTAEALALSERAVESIVITVSEGNRITFTSEGESFSGTVGSNGGFNGLLDFNERGCTAVFGISGFVNGTTVSGDIVGDGECEGIPVEVSGVFSASR